MVKQGSGKLTLGGDNSYTGGTIIEAGTLSIVDNQDFVGDVNIASGAVLNLIQLRRIVRIQVFFWCWGCAQGLGQWADAQWCQYL